MFFINLSLTKFIAGNVLKYFKIHEVYIPDSARLGKVQFLGPPVKRTLVKVSEFKQLPSGNENEEKKT